MLRSAIRTSSFLRKELVEVLRQPRLVLTLVLGPFAILALFGAGLQDFDPPVRTILVAPAGSGIAAAVERFAEQAERDQRIIVDRVTADQEAALAALRRGEVQLVAVFPDDAEELVRADEQAPITSYHNLIDPIETQAIELFSRSAADQVNKQVLEAAIAAGQEDAVPLTARLTTAQAQVSALRLALEAGDQAAAQQEQGAVAAEVQALGAAVLPIAGILAAVQGDGGASLTPAMTAALGRLDGLAQASGRAAQLEQVAALEQDLVLLTTALGDFTTLSPEVVVSPFTAVAERVTETEVRLSDFYAPAVVVLLLQHLLISFIGLSVVREDQLGTTELFRVAPLSALEALLGKYLAYAILGGGVSGALLALMVFVLGVPLLAPWGTLALGVAAVVFASIGLAFVIALLSRSDSQAVQYAMLVLLASVFLGGFLLSLTRFTPALRGLSTALPPTHGIEALRTIMLRGSPATTQVAILGGMGAGLFALSWLLMRRRMYRG